ncbi:MAG: transposase family protein [Caldisericia bacterium]|nr:transposase family protein [Caldisericia bacterium]
MDLNQQLIPLISVNQQSIDLRKLLRDSNGRIEVLKDKSRVPKRRRRREIDIRIIDFIVDVRKRYPKMGKEKIKVLLDEYCRDKGIKTIYSSTIGRIIKERNLFFFYTKDYTHFGKEKKINRKRKLRRGMYRPRNPGDLIEIDAIVLFMNGIKRYIITSVDIRTKFSFAYAYDRPSSKSSLDFFKKLKMVTFYDIKHIQTDNGSEFHKYFRDCLEKEGITQFFIYPKRPRMNSHIERFNRTLKEEFIYENYDDLIFDLGEFNRKLMEYLIFYNTKGPHASINYKNPVKYIIDEFNF